jgi:hypothetical protein
MTASTRMRFEAGDRYLSTWMLTTKGPCLNETPLVCIFPREEDDYTYALDGETWSWSHRSVGR